MFRLALPLVAVMASPVSADQLTEQVYRSAVAAYTFQVCEAEAQGVVTAFDAVNVEHGLGDRDAAAVAQVDEVRVKAALRFTQGERELELLGGLLAALGGSDKAGSLAETLTARQVLAASRSLRGCLAGMQVELPRHGDNPRCITELFAINDRFEAELSATESYDSLRAGINDWSAPYKNCLSGVGQ